ncbi:hypothetical protein AXF42_Ash007157 [Apostasia shenzhenica]|uniref:DC1 domain-containing protein n=1 Tax=Apostasia shenzhenica TaxID=1088818 RepID=A0A2I0BF99_9ASPA|nr:hypothetical protein AXF42_Ash007157 [Apostasia shenzhenica]
MGRHGSSSLTISHFSHPHALHLTASVGPPCFACSLPASQPVAASPSPAINASSFLLHLSYATLPLVVLHPCHAGHGLSLLPRPPYSDGCFTCNACRRPGSGFAYHCSACVLDLHTLCAVAPEAVTNPAHRAHPLTLAFRPPYGDGEGYTCDVCGRGGGASEWLYRRHVRVRRASLVRRMYGHERAGLRRRGWSGGGGGCGAAAGSYVVNITTI